MYERKKNIWQKHLDFMILDIISLQIAYVVAFIVRHGWSLLYMQANYRNVGIIIALVELCLGIFLENYTGIVTRGHFEEFKKVVVMISVTVMSVFTYLFIMKDSEVFSRSVFLQTWMMGMMLTFVVRVGWKRIIQKQLTRVGHAQSLIIVSEQQRILNTLAIIDAKKYVNFRIAGLIIIDMDMRGKELGGIPVIADADTLEGYLRESVVDDVFIDLPYGCERSNHIGACCRDMGITTHVNLGKIFKDTTMSIVENYAGHMVLTNSIKFAEPRQLFVKRLMDIVGGGVGVVIAGILVLFFGPIIYIQSPGSIFFSQERVGKNGRKFKMYKFRSMYPNAEMLKKGLMEHNKIKGPMFKLDNDPRITPIGKFIRKTSLDEFPQFFNVLKGEMSLVGTRPPTVDEYRDYESHHKVRLAAKPGITGMWQISGRSDILDFEEVVVLDKKYIMEWNIGMDMRILLKTVKMVFMGKGSI